VLHVLEEVTYFTISLPSYFTQNSYTSSKFR
jgi:hypothetical protein